jgi:general secretion pathway protein A
MYERYFGLHSPPFELAADPRFLVALPQYREALSNLQYGLTARKGIVVLTGDAGLGKTTVMRAALDALAADASHCVCLTNPALTREEFVEALGRAYGLSAGAWESKTALLVELETYLNRLGPNRLRALILDEAQSLPHDLLEEVRLMSNMEADYRKLLPVVLIGQPELGDRLNDSTLRQLKQRIALRCTLQPLTFEETQVYVEGRLFAAGGIANRLFPRDVLSVLFERTHGVPRLINVVCDNALVAAFAAGRPYVDRETLEMVCSEFDLGVRARPSLASVPAASSTPPPPVPNQYRAEAAHAASALTDRSPEVREPVRRSTTMFGLRS